jgi:hypothetical protein
MPAGSVSTVAEPHSSRPSGLTSFDSHPVSLVPDTPQTGASVAGTGVDCARCRDRGGIYVPALMREFSCPECR